MKKNLFLVQNPADLERCFPVICELRPHLNLQEFLDIYKNAHTKEAYDIIALELDGLIVGAMGYRITHDLVRGKHIYIDDLVITKNERSKRLAPELLQYAEKLAQDNGCKVLRLCAALENTRGMKFYESNGWSQRAVAYNKKVK